MGKFENLTLPSGEDRKRSICPRKGSFVFSNPINKFRRLFPLKRVELKPYRFDMKIVPLEGVIISYGGWPPQFFNVGDLPFLIAYSFYPLSLAEYDLK